jgi:hypothetical protein
MHTVSVPFVQTRADIRRARKVRIAEENRKGSITPDFARQGLGLCRTEGDPDDFTNSETRGSEGNEARRRAKAVCHECPFAEQCLTWGTGTSRTGIFGGVWLSSGHPVVRM